MGHMFERLMSVKTASATPEEFIEITKDQVKALKKLMLSGEARHVPVLSRAFMTNVSPHWRSVNHSVKPTDLVELVKKHLGNRALVDLETRDLILPEEIAEKMRRMTEKGTNFKGYVLGAVTPHFGSKGTSLGTIAHELGHASMAMKGLAGKLRRSTYRLGLPSVLSPVIATGMTAATAGIDVEDPAIYAPTVAMAALQAPVLFEEGLASTKAMKALKQLAKARLANPKEVATAGKDLFAAWKTYAKPAAKNLALPLAVLAAKKGLDAYDKSRSWYDTDSPWYSKLLAPLA